MVSRARYPLNRTMWAGRSARKDSFFFRGRRKRSTSAPVTVPWRRVIAMMISRGVRLRMSVTGSAIARRFDSPMRSRIATAKAAEHANGAIGQQTFEAYAAYILAQHTNIVAHSNLRPFAGNIEGYEDGASEDDGMGGDSLYPPPSYPHTLLPTPCNPITLLTNLNLLNNSYHPPLALVSTLNPTPWQMVFTPTLPP